MNPYDWTGFILLEIAILLWYYRTRRWRYLGAALTVAIFAAITSGSGLYGVMVGFILLSLGLEWKRIGPTFQGQTALPGPQRADGPVASRSE